VILISTCSLFRDITQAFQQFYNSLTSGQVYDQDRPYPCAPCCNRG
jgi:hypothetical protein